MAYPVHIRRRAIELKKGRSAGAVLRELEKEFRGEVTALNARTISRWVKTESAALVEPPVPIEKEQGKIPLISPESLKEHHERLAEIANSLLANNLNNVSSPGWTTNRSRQVKYLIPNKNAASGYDEITKEQLASHLNSNMAAILKDSDWFFRDCFMPHLKSELPKELTTKPFFKIVEEQPYELIEILRVLAARKTFKGTCPTCRAW